jgi:hypothetical protein
MRYAQPRSVSENPVVGPRASGFVTGKDGEVGDIGVYRRCSRTPSSRKTSRSKPDRILRQAPRNRLTVLLLLSVGLGLAPVTAGERSMKAESANTPRRVSFLDRDWRFTKGDVPQATDPAFDDSAWQRIHVPHDWAITAPFNPKENGYAGKLPWKGVGWYRKRFTLAEADAGQRVYIDFDGVMAFPKVYINGKLAGTWDYGYMAFRIDATEFVHFGEENVMAVQVDTRQHGTRWYPGAGIYRPVTMTRAYPIHIAHWGTFVTTPRVQDHSALIRVKTTLENHLEEEAECALEVRIQDPDGGTLALIETPRFTLPAGRGRCEMSSSAAISNPQRWDLDNPRLYRVVTTLRHLGKRVDADMVSFGIRTFEFTADDGFHLNGRRVHLYGVNLHHDHGPLGAAYYTRAMERQLEIMQDMGCNAIRTSHNPPAADLLDLCDRMGILVWDEAFDKWDDKADRVHSEPPLEAYGEKQIRNLVLRDRNHPSVVTWSIGNEIGNQPYDREGKSPERVKYMSDFVRKYDPTRPVGIGCHIPGTADEPILDALDLTGWNYARRYARYRERYPDKPIIYSESASTLSTRGFYNPSLPNEKTEYTQDNQVCSYDLNAVAYKDGRRIGDVVMCTAGVPATLHLTPDRQILKASGQDLCYVLVEALDRLGTICPLAENRVRFQVTGPAEIVGVGNGNPLSLEPFQAEDRNLFYGKAMLILRTQAGQQGEVRITATGDGLSSVSTKVSVR